jgi:hypothetical protein
MNTSRRKNKNGRPCRAAKRTQLALGWIRCNRQAVLEPTAVFHRRGFRQGQVS